MARFARVVVPRLPHHIVQRGNRRQQTFFCEADYVVYIELMAEWCARYKVDVWAYCLMPTHVHLIAAPRTAEGLCRAVGEAHRRYTRHINSREGEMGCLWQGRFASYVVDDEYLRSAACYVALNPVRAGLVARPEDWPWSSARAHLTGSGDPLVKPSILLKHVANFKESLALPDLPEALEILRSHERTGRPLGSKEFVQKIGKRLGRCLLPKKPGPKSKKDEE